MAGLQARAGGATIEPPLPQSAGYIVVVVLGLVVAVGRFLSLFLSSFLSSFLSWLAVLTRQP